MCMAMALEDGGIDGHIITLDRIPSSQKQEWAYDNGDGQGPRIETRSLDEMWEKYISATWRARVEMRSGFAHQLMHRLVQERHFSPDFIYIDGNHRYAATRHDFYARLLIAARPFRILFDDYSVSHKLYGVWRLLDKQVAPIFQLEAIHNDQRWHGESKADTPIAESDYAQVLLDSERLQVGDSPAAMEATFPKAHLQKIVRRYRRAWRLWQVLEDRANKWPFLWKFLESE